MQNQLNINHLKHFTDYGKDFLNSLIHRVDNTHATAKFVHLGHDIHGFGQGHSLSLQFAFEQGLATGLELVLITSNLLGNMNGRDVCTVGAIYCNGLRIVDIVDDEIALGTGYHADIIAHAAGTALQVAQQLTIAATIEHQRDGIGDVHAGIALNTTALHAAYGQWEEHTHKVECVDT